MGRNTRWRKWHWIFDVAMVAVVIIILIKLDQRQRPTPAARAEEKRKFIESMERQGAEASAPRPHVAYTDR